MKKSSKILLSVVSLLLIIPIMTVGTEICTLQPTQLSINSIEVNIGWKKMNPPTGKFCLRCGTPLEVESVMKVEEKRNEMDNLMSALMKDPLVQEFLINRIKELNLGKELQN